MLILLVHHLEKLMLYDDVFLMVGPNINFIRYHWTNFDIIYSAICILHLLKYKFLALRGIAFKNVFIYFHDENSFL
jgi:hypothetical protein